MTGTTENIISLCIGGDKTAFRKLVELYQSYENLQITNRLLDECSVILGITVKDGVDPTEISKMLKNRKKIVIRFRQYLREEVVK